MDDGVKKTVTAIPLLSIRAGPRDPNWGDRLKEELSALIGYVNKNKTEDNDWFKIAPQDKTGTQWKGTCWFVHEHVKCGPPTCLIHRFSARLNKSAAGTSLICSSKCR